MTEEEDVVVTVRGIRATLSLEQIEVLRLIARGWTYRRVGMELGLSEWGVEKRVYSVCDAIGAVNCREALVLLSREGILP